MDPLLQTEFIPLAEAKAKLSEKIRKLGGGRRLLITSHGRPRAVLVSYGDFLGILQRFPESTPKSTRRIKFKDWERERGKREMVVKSITRYFDPTSLPRKGQKDYKRKTVARFVQGS